MPKTYEIVLNTPGGRTKGIKCAFCERTSLNKHDVQRKFCPGIGYFHTEQDFTNNKIEELKREPEDLG